MRILLLTPPMTQLNTPYPATSYLTGFLRSRGVEGVVQRDLALEWILTILSNTGLKHMIGALEAQPSLKRKPKTSAFLEFKDYYLNTIDPVIRFLQGQDPTLAHRIAGREFLPEGPRFDVLEGLNAGLEGDALGWAFGKLGVHDRAKFLATLYLDDIADVIQEGIDGRFAFTRYGEKLAASQASFDVMSAALEAPLSVLDQMLVECVDRVFSEGRPDLVGITAPFPGNVYGAFRIAQRIKQLDAKIPVVLGGGYVNTELRSLEEIRVFKYFDFITYDDGEKPLWCLIEFLQGKRMRSELFRTRVLSEDGQRVEWISTHKEHDVPHRETGRPTLEGIPIDRTLSILEMLNPMHRIWSDGRWNKLTLAHGCYWKKCQFCDTSLDYIGRYDPASAELLVDHIEGLVRETGQSGFHFVDEAAPPATLRALAECLIKRGVSISWWGNLRFEKNFTPELCQLLARSGCIAVTGGLEVASDRLLQKMNKGVSVEQVARVTRAFSDAGVLVHAYLMYGFPTQTEQETVDALERVRQLFEAGCIQSAYWHRFSATVHSPIGKAPESFGIELVPREQNGPLFAENDLAFVDPTECDSDALGVGLRKALYNFMLGNGIDRDVRTWFDRRVPKAQVPATLVRKALKI